MAWVETDEDECEAMDSELKQRWDTIETIESTTGELESVLKFIESVLEESRLEALPHLHEERSGSDGGGLLLIGYSTVPKRWSVGCVGARPPGFRLRKP